jgi:hypothetical protein
MQLDVARSNITPVSLSGAQKLSTPPENTVGRSENDSGQNIQKNIRTKEYCAKPKTPSKYYEPVGIPPSYFMPFACLASLAN